MIIYLSGSIPSSRHTRSYGTVRATSNKLDQRDLSICSNCTISISVMLYQASLQVRRVPTSIESLKTTAFWNIRGPRHILSNSLEISLIVPNPLFLLWEMFSEFLPSELITSPRYLVQIVDFTFTFMQGKFTLHSVQIWFGLLSSYQYMNFHIYIQASYFLYAFYMFFLLSTVVSWTLF